MKKLTYLIIVLVAISACKKTEKASNNNTNTASNNFINETDGWTISSSGNYNSGYFVVSGLVKSNELRVYQGNLHATIIKRLDNGASSFDIIDYCINRSGTNTINKFRLKYKNVDDGHWGYFYPFNDTTTEFSHYKTTDNSSIESKLYEDNLLRFNFSAYQPEKWLIYPDQGVVAVINNAGTGTVDVFNVKRNRLTNFKGARMQGLSKALLIDDEFTTSPLYFYKGYYATFNNPDYYTAPNRLLSAFEFSDTQTNTPVGDPHTITSTGFDGYYPCSSDTINLNNIAVRSITPFQDSQNVYYAIFDSNIMYIYQYSKSTKKLSYVKQINVSQQVPPDASGRNYFKSFVFEKSSGNLYFENIFSDIYAYNLASNSITLIAKAFTKIAGFNNAQILERSNIVLHNNKIYQSVAVYDKVKSSDIFVNIVSHSK